MPDWMILANITQNVQTALNRSLEVFSIFPIIDTIADGALDRNDNGISASSFYSTPLFYIGGLNPSACFVYGLYFSKF